MDRKFVMAGLIYAVVGMALGIYMGASENHGQYATHAHIMLLGFVLSFIYALCHKLWLDNDTSTLAITQFYVHQVAAAVMVTALFLHYGGYVATENVGPVLGLSSIAALAGMVMMCVLFLRAGTRSKA